MPTDTPCRTAKPKDKPYQLLDGNGLYLEIKPNGVTASRYRFELRDGAVAKAGLIVIGDYVGLASTILAGATSPRSAFLGEMENG